MADMGSHCCYCPLADVSFSGFETRTVLRSIDVLQNRKLGIAPVRHQHAAGIMRDAEFRLHGRDDRLRCHSAGPEHRQFIVAHFDGVAIVGAS